MQRNSPEEARGGPVVLRPLEGDTLFVNVSTFYVTK